MVAAVCIARQHGRHLIGEATHTRTRTQPMTADELQAGCGGGGGGGGVVEVVVIVVGHVET